MIVVAGHISLRRKGYPVLLARAPTRLG